MSLDRTNNTTNDLPIAESTQIETAAKTPLRRLKLTLANKFGLLGNRNSPIEMPPAKRTATNTPPLNKLDPQVYLDTQSNGFASRVVKYHDESEAKNRAIGHTVYRRPGDFPIVNLDKSDLNLNQKQANAPKVSKINIAPPINLLNASNLSARSSIFRTGKNCGDSYANEKIGPIGPIEGRKPIRPSLSQDEPIVPTNNEYDNTPTRSSLEALKEISRKRIHCDEIDGDANKKQCSDSVSNDHDQNSVQITNAAKRARDRTSPSYCSATAEASKKRYKNNDILSSLSSSLMSTPKRSPLNTDTPTKVIHLDHDIKRNVTDRASNDNVIHRPHEHRVGASNSDLPLHRSSEPIKPVTKSMSDGYVPVTQATNKPKLTLFNKVYSNEPAEKEKKRPVDDDDDEENSISFVKPKAKISNIFGANRNRESKSKLEMMLSFLKGDESKDVVDSVAPKLVSTDKTEQKDDKSVANSLPTNLTTTTTVTFSTATTTSLLNASSNAINLKPTVPTDTQNKVTIEAPKPEEAKPLIAISLPKTSTLISSATDATSKPSDVPAIVSSAPKPAPTVTFSLPTSLPVSTASIPSTTSESAPRLGGFSFSATPAPSIPTLAMPVPVTAATKPEETKPAAPSFSFGLAKPSNSTTLPAYTPPSFGASALSKPETTPATSATTQASSVPSFSFGAPATQPAATKATTGFVFGAAAAATAATTANAPTAVTSSAPPAFSFGGASTAPSTTAAAVASTVASSAFASSPIVFGSNAPTTTSAPAFGLANTAPKVTSSGGLGATFGSSTPAFSFGGPAAASKPETSAFQFGDNKTANATAAPLSFGAPAVTNATPTIATFGAAATANPSPAPQSAFAFGATKPNAVEKPSIFGTPSTQPSAFGGFSTPTFGSATPAANTPVFGSSNITPAQPKTENTFGITANASNTTPVFGSQAQTSAPAFGSGSSVFGSTPNTQSQPAFGASSNIFSTPTTAANPTQPASNAFGSATPGVFAFGQTATPAPATTTAQPAAGGIFGSPNTNTNAGSPFVFGQSNAAGMFDPKPAANTNTNTAMTAPPAFGSTSPAFNFSAKPVFGSQTEAKPSAFSFNSTPAQNSAPASVSAFGSAPAAPQFGATNGMGSSFSFNATNNQTDAAKPFNFGGPATAPAAAQSPFSFGAASPAPTQSAPNAFQFGGGAAPQPAANIFSIGPGTGTASKTGRPIRTAVRRMK